MTPRIRAYLAVAATFALTGCLEVVGPAPGGPGAVRPPSAVAAPSARQFDRFRVVVARVEPVAEQLCRARRPELNCDYRIVIDDDPRAAPNAYQTRDRTGRPVIGFTRSLIADARNADELAFILGHEAAHHIRNHIPRGQSSAMTGAAIGGILATVLGADGAGVRQAANLGGFVNSRRFSADFELEADRLGTRITHAAGYDPVRGALYFTRIPDPGNGFLASHPPNDRRLREVERVAAGL